MTKLRYVGTHAQEFPGPDDTRIMLGPGEYLEDADTENEEVKAATDEGLLVAEDGSGEREGFVVENNEPDKEQPQVEAEVVEEVEKGGESS